MVVGCSIEVEAEAEAEADVVNVRGDLLMKHYNHLLEIIMKTTQTKLMHPSLVSTAFVISLFANAVYATNQMTFSSPQEAVKVLVDTLKNNDTKKLMEILGPAAKPLLESGDAVEDQENRNRFLKAYEEGNKLEKSGDTKFVLAVGRDQWQFPIPLIKETNSWYFDTEAGKEEILNRRIGRNELSAIQAVLAYVEAQSEYYLANPQQDKLLSYAQKFMSAPNKHDGLYYPVKAGEQASPLGEIYAKAQAAGYGDKKEGSKSQAYYGYYYRIIKSQGPDAPGGAYDYVVQGKMIGGFALIAWPATYNNSGVMTFMVNQDGIVYEKDLGPDTAEVAQKINTFNPDKTWKPVSEHF